MQGIIRRYVALWEHGRRHEHEGCRCVTHWQNGKANHDGPSHRHKDLMRAAAAAAPGPTARRARATR